MARTKQSARNAGPARRTCLGGYPRRPRMLAINQGPCFERRIVYLTAEGTQEPGESYLPRQSPKKRVSSSTTKKKLRSEFLLFPKLPLEIQIRIWEMTTEQGRVVAVRSSAGNGLRSSTIPNIFHVCHTSRLVGLKYYPLSFQGIEESDASGSLSVGAFFNFDRDTLFFKEGWNERIDGPWSCFNQLSSLLNPEDVHKVQAIGFDLRARICSSRAVGNHFPLLEHWIGLKTMYLGMPSSEGGDPTSEIELRQLNTKPSSSECKYFLEENNRVGGAFKVDMPQNYAPHRVPQGARWETGYATEVENVMMAVSHQFQLKGWTRDGFSPKIAAVRIVDL